MIAVETTRGTTRKRIGSSACARKPAQQNRRDQRTHFAKDGDRDHRCGLLELPVQLQRRRQVQRQNHADEHLHQHHDRDAAHAEAETLRQDGLQADPGAAVDQSLCGALSHTAEQPGQPAHVDHRAHQPGQHSAHSTADRNRQALPAPRRG